MTGDGIIWLNVDIRPYGSYFEIQIVSNDEIGWAMYYSATPSNCTSAAPNGQQLSGDWNNLTGDNGTFPSGNIKPLACGTASSSTWNVIGIPDFTKTTNFYIAFWEQTAGAQTNFEVTFKARFGCGGRTPTLCALQADEPSTVCNGDGTYTLNIPIHGINAQYYAYDESSNNVGGLSSSICLLNPGVSPFTVTGTLSLTYDVGTPYNVTIFEANDTGPPTPVTNSSTCANPSNPDGCTTGVSGQSPTCPLAPTCSITGSSGVCASSTGNTFTAPAGMTTYAWSISGSGSIVGAANGQTVNVTAGASGSFTLSLTITDATTLSSTCTKVVSINALPACTISGANTACASSTGNTYSAPANMMGYAWSIGGDGSIVGVNNGQNVSVTAGASGNVTLSTQAQVNAFSQCYSVIQGQLIIQNSGISTLLNLSNLVKVTGNVVIKSTSLISLNGLHNLDTIGGNLTIFKNVFGQKLQSLDGLEDLNWVGGNLKVYNNTKLSDCCAIHPIIGAEPNGVGGSISIYGNKTGCESIPAVNLACGSTLVIPPTVEAAWISESGSPESTMISTRMEKSGLQVFPNPLANGQELTLRVQGDFVGGMLRVFDTTGRVLLQRKLEGGSQELQIEVSDWKPGIYLVQALLDGELLTQKMVVE